MSDEIGYLIEHREYGSWAYISTQPRVRVGWTRDNEMAMRFSRRQDAEGVRLLMQSPENLVVTEHIWLAAEPDREPGLRERLQALVTEWQRYSYQSEASEEFVSGWDAATDHCAERIESALRNYLAAAEREEPAVAAQGYKATFERWWDDGEWEAPNEHTLAECAFEAGWKAAAARSSEGVK